MTIKMLTKQKGMVIIQLNQRFKQILIPTFGITCVALADKVY